MQTSALPAAALQARGAQLRAEVTDHKAAMRRHREQLRAAASALAAIETECRRRGIAVYAKESHDGTQRPGRSAD